MRYKKLSIDEMYAYNDYSQLSQDSKNIYYFYTNELEVKSVKTVAKFLKVCKVKYQNDAWANKNLFVSRSEELVISEMVKYVEKLKYKEQFKKISEKYNKNNTDNQ